MSPKAPAFERGSIEGRGKCGEKGTVTDREKDSSGITLAHLVLPMPLVLSMFTTCCDAFATHLEMHGSEGCKIDFLSIDWVNWWVD